MPQESFTPWFIHGIELCVFIARKMPTNHAKRVSLLE